MKKFPLLMTGVSALALAACQPSAELAAPTASEPAVIETPAPPEAEPMVLPMLGDKAAQNPELSTFLAAVNAAGLGDELAASGSFTVFAPTNAAFAALPPGTVDNLLKPENKDKLAAMLNYHIVPGVYKAADVPMTATDMTTANGKMVPVLAGPDGVTVGGAKVTSADGEASNGVLHVIDKVLMPPK